MAEVIWTDPAIDDVVEIAEFIGRDSFRYASETVSSRHHAVARLEEFPESGRILPELGLTEIREVIIENYRIVYMETSKVCFVLAVVHVKQDMLSKISGRISTTPD